MITRPHRRRGHLAHLAPEEPSFSPLTPGPLLITDDWHPLPLPPIAADQVTAEAWSDASLILLTAPSTLHLPGHLPSRPGIFVLADRDVAPAVWTRLAQFSEDVMILCWPTCRPWLEEQLLAPDPEFLPDHLVH